MGRGSENVGAAVRERPHACVLKRTRLNDCLNAGHGYV
jgi:hypothetical protein